MNYQLSLPLLDETTEDNRIKALLKSVKAKVGFVPNLYAAMANVPMLLEAYLSASDHFRLESAFSAIEQEVILLSISYINGCTYCMAAHSTIADNDSHVPPEITDAIRAGIKIQDEKLQALVMLTQALVIDRGWANSEYVSAFLRAGYNEKHILGILFAIGMKTLSNYTNHLFNPPIDEQFKRRIWQKPALE